MNEALHIHQLLAGKSKVGQIVGSLVSISADGAIVDVGGGRIPARTVGNELPEINDSVWVFFIDGQPYVMGASVPKPGQGVVTAVVGDWCTLSTDYGTVTVPYMRGITPTVGDLWKLVWQGGGFAVAPMSTEPVAPVPPPAPTNPVGSHVDKFDAFDAGSYSSSYGGWSNPQVLAADHWQGAWFQGTKIADTVPSTAVISKVEIYVSPQSVSGANPTFALHNYTSKPGGAPTFGTNGTYALTGGWLQLPNSWGDELKAGGDARGIGINHGGFSTLSSLAQDGLSGSIRITSQY